MLASKAFGVLFSDHPLALVLFVLRSFNFEIEDGAGMEKEEREEEIIYVKYRRKEASESSVFVGGNFLACCQQIIC